MEESQEDIKNIYMCLFVGCTSVFDNPSRLHEHHLRHVNLKSFVCTEANCNKEYTSRSHLVRHIKNVHNKSQNETFYSCPICMKTYSNRQNLKRHIKMEHEESKKPFVCEVCNMDFKKMEQLEAHTYIHTGLKAFRCQHCDKVFVSANEKTKHMRNHKIHRCEHCEATFNRWTDLMCHKRNFHESPEYICNECGKCFKERQNILRHMKYHSPVAFPRIFYCPYKKCKRYYSRNSNLNQHILTRHKGKTFDCEHCGAKLVAKAKLNAHIRKKHQSNNTKPKEMKKEKKTLFVDTENLECLETSTSCNNVVNDIIEIKIEPEDTTEEATEDTTEEATEDTSTKMLFNNRDIPESKEDVSLDDMSTYTNGALCETILTESEENYLL